MRRRGADALVLALYVCAAIVMTWPLASHPTRLLPSDLIDTLLNTWILGWDADRLRHGMAGVWDAPIFFPYRNSLAFSENLFGLAVFVAPVYWATHNAILTYNAAFIGSFALAGFGMHLLAVEVTGNRAAALVAGAYYAFCPYRMAQIDHIQMIATGWLPIGLCGLHRYFSTRRRQGLALFVVAYALQVTSNLYAAYVMAIPAAFIALHGFATSRGAWRPLAREVGVAAAVLTLALLPIGIPYYQARVDYRNVRNSVEIEMNSADLRAYVLPIDSIGVWRRLPAAVPLYGEKALFPGLLIVALGCVAVVDARRHRSPARRWLMLYGVIAATALLISLGPHVRVWGVTLTDHGPYDWFWLVVPGWDGLRVPARFGLLVFLSLSVIGGLGANSLLRALNRPAQVGAAACGVAIVLAEGWVVPMRTVPYSRLGRPEDRELTAWLSRQPAGAVLDMPMVTDNFEELHYQYATLLHGHPVVNGMSGYNSGLQRLFRNPEGPLYDWERPGAVVRMLRALGIRYVAVHHGDYTRAERAAGEEEHTIAQLRQSGQLAGEHDLSGARVFELQPFTEPPTPRPGQSIDPREFSVHVSTNEDRAQYLTDNDGDTRWFAEQNGGPVIEVSFGAATDVAAVGFEWAERSLTDYPRELTVESHDAAGASRTLYRNTPYAEAVVGFVRNGFYPRMTVPLPENRSVRLQLRQTGAVPGRRWWSVHELRLWKR